MINTSHRNYLNLILCRKRIKQFFLFLMMLPIIWAVSGVSPVFSAAYPYPGKSGGRESLMPVIGFIDSHQVKERQTLLEIAREYGLGYNQIVLYHPEIDPWLPQQGLRLDIPTKWILPPTRYEEIVINIPEMRLYRFFKELNMVRTYPIGIGKEGHDTPVGETHVVERIKNPSWTVPPNSQAQEKYGRRVLPPGPENPLGEYWIGLSINHVGIHGTNFPWGVGRRVSYGCIRMYPEHIDQFYREADPGTRVEIIYAPVKVGVKNEHVFLEVHPDLDGRIPDMEWHAWKIIQAGGLVDAVDPVKVRQCIEAIKGVPTNVSRDF
jgi:L,D-transpeptidase ErfK/SrfK